MGPARADAAYVIDIAIMGQSCACSFPEGRDRRRGVAQSAAGRNIYQLAGGAAARVGKAITHSVPSSLDTPFALKASRQP